MKKNFKKMDSKRFWNRFVFGVVVCFNYMSIKISEVIDEMTENVRNIQRGIFILLEDGGRTEEQIQILGRATESLAIWETEDLHEIRKVFKLKEL